MLSGELSCTRTGLGRRKLSYWKVNNVFFTFKHGGQTWIIMETDMNGNQVFFLCTSGAIYGQVGGG